MRDASRRALGRARWRFALLRRRYAVEDAAGLVFFVDFRHFESRESGERAAEGGQPAKALV